MNLTAIKKLVDLDLHELRVLIREDFNVPMTEQGTIADATRLDRALPTIELALDKGAEKVILMSHLGRPAVGKFDAQFSLKPVAAYLTKALSLDVGMVPYGELDPITILQRPEKILLLENVRFNDGEKTGDTALAKQYAALADVFVMDAFATSHRREASTSTVAKFAKIACAGPLLVSELEALTAALLQPKRPVLAIVGGSKVSSKIDVLESLLDKVDHLIVGGGIANTLLAASGVKIGQSLYESDWLAKGKALLEKAEKNKVTLPLPQDVVVAKQFSKDASATIKNVADIEDDDMVLDIGPETIQVYKSMIADMNTIIWNGPVGVFEFPAFAAGTKAVASAVANSDAYSLAGGGDTIAAIQQFHLSDNISYISTGGGAFLEFVEGKDLPGVLALAD